MASLSDAFAFPLTNQENTDTEAYDMNIPNRSSYVPFNSTTDTYTRDKLKGMSDLSFYNVSLKEQQFTV